MQDIAGCRVVVGDIVEQDRVVQSIRNSFPGISTVDRRKSPSHGYRAVHAIAEVNDKIIEIQVRSSSQHLWAELSEKLSDVIDPAIKYGGGQSDLQQMLAKSSRTVVELEELETNLAKLPDQEKIRRGWNTEVDRLKQDLQLIFQTSISWLQRQKGREK